MRFGLSEEQFQILDEKVLRPLILRKAQVFIFGSRARGQHHPFSDIDLLYKEDPTEKINVSTIAQIKEDIENSNLAIKVDLVKDTELATSYRLAVEQDLVQVT